MSACVANGAHPDCVHPVKPVSTVTVWCETGETWSTRFNGTQADAVRYFFGRWFNVGKPYAPDEDHMVKVNRVAWKLAD